MKLQKITLDNIRSYEHAVIEFPTGTTLLSGGIGAGKTTILLAIEYALFGLQPGQRGAALLANNADNGKVTLEFMVDGNSVAIERSLKRTSKTVSQDTAAITINGERFERSVTEVKTKVLQLLHYPEEFIKKTNILYRFTVYTPQEEMKQIILENPESRLNILRHVFGIDKYKKIRENLSVITQKMREEARMLTVEIRDLEVHKNELETTKSLIKHRTTQVGEKKLELEAKVAERKRGEQESEDAREKIKEKEKFEAEVEKTSLMLATKRNQKRREEDHVKELQRTIESARGQFSQVELTDTIAAIGRTRNEIEGLQKLLIECRSKKQSLEIKKEEDAAKKQRIFKIDMCPTCLQDVTETHKSNILNETENSIAKSDKEITTLENEIYRVEQELSKVRARLEEYEERKSQLELLRHKEHELKEAKERLVEITASQESIDKDILFLENHMQFLKQSVLQYAKFNNLYEAKERELREVRHAEKAIEIEIAQLTKEVEMLSLQTQTLQKTIENLEKVRDRLHYVVELEKWLSTDYANLVGFTERTIMMTVRQEFSRLFNTWFGMLTTDAFHVHLDENFTPVITQGDFELDYAFLSGGERTAVALAYRLALNQIIDTMLSNIKTRGLIILDEPTDGFSDAQLDKIRDIIQELNAHQLILVSHENKVESFVDNVVRVTKENGVSIKEVS